MIQQETKLKVIDNSGAKIVKCIKVLKGFKRKFAFLGDIVIITIKTVKDFSKIKKGEIYKALIIRTKKKIKNKDGCSINLFENAVSLISKQKQRRKITIPIANRIFGPIPKKLAVNFPEFIKISNKLF